MLKPTFLPSLSPPVGVLSVDLVDLLVLFADDVEVDDLLRPLGCRLNSTARKSLPFLHCWHPMPGVDRGVVIAVEPVIEEVLSTSSSMYYNLYQYLRAGK